jgi:dTDP-4-dehydrorhamnose 3,5-epimerase
MKRKESGLMPFTLTALTIEGLYSAQPRVFGDARGYFMETHSGRDFAAAGLDAVFVQDNESKSRRGVLRGLHFQKSHPQGKLVRVISGEVFDVAVDLRWGSPSFGKWEGMRLSGKLKNQFYIAPGFAHGFLVLSEEALFTYKCTDFYYPEDEDGIRWDDPDLGIVWPELGGAFSFSEKDAALPAFDPGRRYFDAKGRPL